jgi:homoserine kinase type II
MVRFTGAVFLGAFALRTLAFTWPKTARTMSSSRTFSSLDTTGSNMSPDALCAEAVKYFLSDTNLKFAPTSGGVNNIMQYVEDSAGKKYLVRVYNNGLNSARVKFEHDVLNQVRPKKLSVKIPTTIPSLKGETYVKLSNGAEACLFEWIPGKLPKLTAVEEIGRASGELATAMEDVTMDINKCPNPPYFELFKVHHAVTREAFFKTVEGPEFDGCRQATTELVAAIVDIEKKLKSTKFMSLPKQMIHGDLHYDNVLVENDKVGRKEGKE